MGQSSINGGDEVQEQAGGFDQASLGPSDTSDSGSDVAGMPDQTAGDDMPFGDGPLDLDRTSTTRGPVSPGSDTDSTGTGERSGVEPDTAIREGSDVAPDRIVGDLNAGLTGELLPIEAAENVAVDDNEEDDDEESDREEAEERGL